MPVCHLDVLFFEVLIKCFIKLGCSFFPKLCICRHCSLTLYMNLIKDMYFKYLFALNFLFSLLTAFGKFGEYKFFILVKSSLSVFFLHGSVFCVL